MSRSGVPAWKRLGLKLKYANEDPEKPPRHDNSTAGTHVTNISPNEAHPSTAEPPKKKRRTESKPNGILEQPIAASNLPLQATNGNGKAPKKAPKKQVSFATDTKPDSLIANDTPTQLDESKVEAVQAANPSKMSKKKSGKKSLQPAVQKSNTALDYLESYHTARESWKFNKNRETWILKHALSESEIPRKYDIALARYMHGLQGTGARERLRAQCLETLKEKDPENTTDGTEKNEQYTLRLKGELANTSSSDAADGKDSSQDEDYHSWMREQPRPKILLWALGPPFESLPSHGGSLTSPSLTGQVNGVDSAANGKVRKRKNRTVVVDYDTSSSDSSSSDSESSSEGEDGDSDGKAINGGQSDEDTSSSGSDSAGSSSGSGSDTN